MEVGEITALSAVKNKRRMLHESAYCNRNDRNLTGERIWQ